MKDNTVADASEKLETLTVVPFPTPERGGGGDDDETPDSFWAYLAGLIDGDGTIVYTVTPLTRTKGKAQLFSRTMRVSLTMCDLDILETVKSCADMGNISVERRPGQGNATKTAYRWSVSAREDVLILLTEVHPYLGARKSGAALEALEIITHWNLLGAEKAKAKAEAKAKAKEAVK